MTIWTTFLGEWKDIPVVAVEWEEWEDHEQLDFVLEWTIREDRLHQLQGWCEQGLFTPVQQARYDELLQLVTRYRPMLEQRLKD